MNYKIENFKDVSSDKYILTDIGRVFKKDGTELKQTPNIRGGYPCVTLYSEKSQRSYFVTIHSLMKYYIFKNFDPEVFINHKDGVKTNNDISNLELSNSLHNTHHAIDTGLFIATKITDEMIVTIREFIQENPVKYNCVELSKLYNIPSSSIYRIVKGTIRKNSNLSNLEEFVFNKQKETFKYKDEIIIAIVHNNESISSIIKRYKCDYETVKKMISEYLSGKLEISSTTIESINVTPKENKVSA